MQANRGRIPMKRIRTGGIGRDRQKNALKGPFAARRTIYAEQTAKFSGQPICAPYGRKKASGEKPPPAHKK